MNIAFGDETIILYMHITCVQDKYHHQQQICIFNEQTSHEVHILATRLFYRLVNITSDKLNFMKKTGWHNIIFIVLNLFCSVVKMTCQENYIY